ncbi:MAG: peptidoglycan-binding protein [Clostridia bacterium]|nr:peptidoglycan-binding protein [Clostridia bacterium]
MKLRRMTALVLAAALLLALLPAALAAAGGGWNDECIENRKVDAYGTYTYGKHNWVKVSETPGSSCTSKGTATYRCSYCSATVKRDTKAPGHKWDKWKTTKEATCTERGEEVRKCRVCGEKERRRTDRKAHSWGEWTVTAAPTDFTMGTRVHTCQVCGTEDASDFYPEGTLKRGDKGDAVKDLQEKLNAAGYDCGKADGDFGKKTEAAVKALEEAHGSAADGIAWPGVQKWLEHGWLVQEFPVDELKDISESGDIQLTGIMTGMYGQASISAEPGTVSHTGFGADENVLAEIVVTNTGSVPVSIAEGYAGQWTGGPGTPLHTGPEEDAPRVDVSPVALEPGESVSLWLNAHPTYLDYDRGDLAYKAYVFAYPSDYEPPQGGMHVVDSEHFIAGDFCTIWVPLAAQPGQKLRLTQGNVSIEGEGLDARITVDLRAENLTNGPLTVSMHHYDADLAEYDSYFVEWTGKSGDLFTLEPGAYLDFPVLLRPFPGEAEDEFVFRWVRARALEEDENGEAEIYQQICVYVPLEYAEDGSLLIKGAAAEPPIDNGAFRAHLDVKNDTDSPVRSVRFQGEVLGEDGSLLRTLDFPAESDALDPGETGGADLEFKLTDEIKTQRELTFMIWATAEEYGTDEFSQEKSVLIVSPSYWFCNVRSDEAHPFDAPVRSLAVEAKLSEGDRLYRVGETIPLDIKVTNTGDVPFNDYLIALDPLDTSTGLLILDELGWESELSFWGDGGLEPGETWTTRYEGVVVSQSVARVMNGFGIEPWVSTRNYDTGVVTEARGSQLTVRIVDNDAGLVLILETDAVEYTPTEPIVFRVGVRNDGDAPLEPVRVSCRRGTESQANVTNWIEVVMETDKPIQPGETVWREDFLCWPTKELEGGDMHVNFEAHSGSGYGHPVARKYLIFECAE